MRKVFKRTLFGCRHVLVFILIFSWVFSGWPQTGNFPPKIQPVFATITASSTTYGAGTFTYIVSTNACEQVIDAWGPGGGGSIGNQGGTGGGGGAFASSTLTLSVSGSHTLVIPAGSAEDVKIAQDISNTTFGGTTVVATGGEGENGNNGPTIGGTTAGSTGTTLRAGGAGGNGNTGGDVGGGGGGAGGPEAAGENAANATSGNPTDGGDGNGVGGNGGAGGTAGSPGNPGAADTAFGGGGGGGGGTSSNGGTGGNPGGGGGSGESSGGDQKGGDGQITITEYVDDTGCGSPPTVTTDAATNVTVSSALLNGDITATGGSNATERGFAWGTVSTLSGGDTSTTTETGDFGTGTFSQAVINLLSNQTYYFRAYATNPNGTGYGTSILNFTTGTDTTLRRILRLFEGFTIKFISGRIILHQSQ